MVKALTPDLILPPNAESKILDIFGRPIQREAFELQAKSITAMDLLGIPTVGGNSLLSGSNAKQLVRYYAGTVFAAAKMHCDRICGTHLRLYNAQRNQKSLRFATKDLKRFEQVALVRRSTAKYLMIDTNLVKEVVSHPALALLRRPNPYMTGRQYRRYSELFKLISGVSYSEMRFQGNEPIQLWILPSQCVEVEKDQKTGLPISFDYGGDKIAVRDMLVDCDPNLNAPYSHEGGTSPVKATLAQLNLLNYLTGKLTAIMAAPKFSGILSPKGEDVQLTETQRIRWQSRINEFRNARQGDILFLDADSSWQSVQQTATDLAAIEVMRQIDEHVTRSFSVPRMLITGQENTSRASFAAAMEQWVQTSLLARLNEIEDHYNHNLLPLFGISPDSGWFFAFDDPSPNLLEDKADLFVGLVNKLLTVDECRAELGWEPLPDGQGAKFGVIPQLDSPSDLEGEDEEASEPDNERDGPVNETVAKDPQKVIDLVAQVADGTIPRDSGQAMLVGLFGLTDQQAVAFLGSAGQEDDAEQPETQSPQESDAEPEQAQEQPADDPHNDDEEETDEDAKKALRVPHAGTVAHPPHGKQLDHFVGIIRKHYAKLHESWRHHAHKAVAGIETKQTPEGVVVKNLPGHFIPSNEWSKDLAKDSQPVIEMFMTERGDALLKRVGASDRVFNVFNDHVANAARTASLDFADSTLETTTKAINKAVDETKEAIAEGLETGQAIDQMADRVSEIFEGLSSERAELIAKTESCRAWTEGLKLSAKASGVVTGFQWLTTSDPCDICADLNGKTFDLNTDAGPPEHPGCLCVFLEILGDDSEAPTNTESEET